MASYTLKDYQMLISVEECLQKLIPFISNRMPNQPMKDILMNVKDLLDVIQVCMNEQEDQDYHEYFQAFADFCIHFTNNEFKWENYEQLEESLQTTLECVSHMIAVRESKYHKCCCCKQTVIYLPLPGYFTETAARHGYPYHCLETLNREEYSCPICQASDRDRFIISYLDRLNLPYASQKEKLKVLQFAPAASIENWLKESCPHIEYHSTDLYMESVTFRADIQNMDTVADNFYDIVICSHVLEHVRDDRAAMKEIYRILKPCGICLFLVPLPLDAPAIDEEWGLSESENWGRFGQDDHCRVYSKQGLIDRLTESGFQVHSADKDYLGEEFFHTVDLTDTSTLYILSKQKTDGLSALENMLKDEWQTEMKQQPLVSVIMSAYNHEPFVGEAIESVLGQTYQNIEFLVADDGSSDGTAEVIRKYEDKITRVYYHSDNLGGRGKELLSVAKGKYTARMNSDDVWELDKIEKQVRILEANPQFAACFTWCDYTDEKLNRADNFTFYQSNRSKEEWMQHFFDNGNCLCHPSILIITEIYRSLSLGSVQAFRQIPDYVMWVQLVQQHEIYILPDVMVKMRRYISENRTNTSAISTVNTMRTLMEEMYLWYNTFKEMDLEYFKHAFHKKFVNPDAQSREELLCEKFFLLKSNDSMSCNLASILLFYDLYKDAEAVECCVSVYHFTGPMFWEYCGQSGFIQLLVLGQSLHDKN